MKLAKIIVKFGIDLIFLPIIFLTCLLKRVYVALRGVKQRPNFFFGVLAINNWALLAHELRKRKYKVVYGVLSCPSYEKDQGFYDIILNRGRINNTKTFNIFEYISFFLIYEYLYKVIKICSIISFIFI